jgi:phage tail-like protein
MDANGQHFWMWSEAADWRSLDDAAFRTQSPPFGSRMLALESERALAPDDLGERIALGEPRLAALPALRDRQGTYARWDPVARVLRGYGAFATGDVPVPGTGLPTQPLALAIDGDQVVLMAHDTGIELVDLRERFAPLRIPYPDIGGEPLRPHKLACDGRSGRHAGRWILDRVHRRLARVVGAPMRDRAFVDYDPSTFRPQPENPHPPVIEVLPLALPAGEDAVLVAASRAGRVAVVGWGADSRVTLHLLSQGPDGAWTLSPGAVLEGAERAHSLAWVDEQRIALMASALDEALVYDADDPDRPIPAVGRRYPLRRHAGGPFLAAQEWPPHYACDPEPPSDDVAPVFSRALVPLSWQGYRSVGRARGRTIDGGEYGMTWHRLYAEASIPPGCAIVLEFAALDDEVEPAAADWHVHWLGDRHALEFAGAAVPADAPRAAWIDADSEIALHPGLLGCARERERHGLWTALLQRSGRALRELRGRFLHLRVTLIGNGRATPLVAAVRTYGARFSYVRRYLPEIYRDDDEFDRDLPGPATRADFHDRFVALFESVLTPLEDTVAGARVLTHPASAPEASLPWLAEWTGVRFPAALPMARRRAWLASGPERRRRRGTLAGLALALDVATGGAVSAGRIVVVENFRLRRTLATLLGVDIAPEEDPLLPGLVVSGNSLVGDTLILGDEAGAHDFLAAFLPEALGDAREAAETDLYARTAHRATVLVHDALADPHGAPDERDPLRDSPRGDALRRVLEAVIAEEAPAHVEVGILSATRPLMVGVAALVGVDTYLREPLPVRIARIDVSRIGRGDVIEGGSAFDWRLEAGVAPPSDAAPVARIDAPDVVAFGADFELDGRRSSAGPGRRLVRWRWMRTS